MLKDQRYQAQRFLEVLCPKGDGGGYFFSQGFFPVSTFLPLVSWVENLKSKTTTLKVVF